MIQLFGSSDFADCVGQNVSHRADQLLGVRNVKELVRAMSIRSRTKNSCDDKLCSRPLFAEESHERN